MRTNPSFNLNRRALTALLSLAAVGVGVRATETGAGPAQGPLRPHPKNSRYFTDGSGKAIYLTGSHTWNNFQDGGWAAGGEAGRWSNNLGKFDFDGYLAFLRENHHNFIRLWTPENAADVGEGNPVE